MLELERSELCELWAEQHASEEQLLGSAGGTGDGPTATGKLLLKPEEAAVVLGISRTKVYELLAAGAVRSVQIGKCRRIPRRALDDFVQQLG